MAVGFLILSKYQIENEEMTELTSISYWFENMSGISSSFLRRTLSILAILPGPPLQLGLIIYSIYQTVQSDQGGIIVLDGPVSRLFVLSLMYSMVNIIVYFSLSISRANGFYAWVSFSFQLGIILMTRIVFNGEFV